MEPATIDRIQRMIDDEATERFPAGAVPGLVLLRDGDHPVIEPGELYLQVILGQDGPGRPEEKLRPGSKDFAHSGFPRSRGLLSLPTSPTARAAAPPGS